MTATGKVPVRVTDRLAVWVEKSLAKHAAGEQTLYDVGIQLLPQGGFAHVFLVSMPGALLGSWSNVALPLTDAQLATEDGVDGLVRNAVEALRKRRTDDLSAQLNGNPPGGVT